MSYAESQVSPNSKSLQGSKKRRVKVTRSEDQRLDITAWPDEPWRKAATIQAEFVAPMPSGPSVHRASIIPAAISTHCVTGVRSGQVTEDHEEKRSLFFRLDAAIAYEHDASHPANG